MKRGGRDDLNFRGDRGRGRASTLGRLRPAANDGCGDAIPDNRRCDNLAGLYRGYTVIYAFALYYIYRLLRDGLRDDWQRHARLAVGLGRQFGL
jgi:hypothetical protein